MSPALPLAVYSATATCDRCGVEGDLITDGHRAYALTGVYVNQAKSGWESDLILRTGASVEVTCTAVKHDETCGGTLSFNIAEEGSWHGLTPDTASLLVAGQPMEGTE